ncbi:MAG TPA: AtpZ/AtpI family protein [Ignavibacteria bacterium]|nr:AtpZ/AtpI family protein [Ignavibacteria bacterium]
MIEDPDSGSKTGKKDDKESEFEKVAKSYRTGWLYAEYAFQYGVAIVLCTLIGYWLDNWLNTGNILMIVGVLFGSVGGFINLLRAVNTKKPAGKKDGK